MSEDFIDNLEIALGSDFLTSAEATDIDEENITRDFMLDIEDDLPVLKVRVVAPNQKGENFYTTDHIEESLSVIQKAYSEYLEEGKPIKDSMLRDTIKYYYDCLTKVRILEDMIFEAPRTDRTDKILDDLYQDFLEREDQRILKNYSKSKPGSDSGSRPG